MTESRALVGRHAASVRAPTARGLAFPRMKVDDSKATRELLASLRALCARLPGAEEYVMVHHPAFRIAKKPFAIAGMDQDRQGATLSVNLGREAQAGLLEDARFARTPYIGQHGWVTIPSGQLRRGELDALVTESWRRVANPKQRAQLEAALPSRKR